eukprot:TRINITY_DN64884_c0_g2_i1.p3 TRINITY_DN64884_c0_g2~~TRINITY_DN64884_c0_g2_i1.p3  ORF type:complete len:121 (-),score=18.34 TRINITY_DN64884_c0_g2_i1:755-1117(-)
MWARYSSVFRTKGQHNKDSAGTINIEHMHPRSGTTIMGSNFELDLPRQGEFGEYEYESGAIWVDANGEVIYDNGRRKWCFVNAQQYLNGKWSKVEQWEDEWAEEEEKEEELVRTQVCSKG